jgi:hypothetical protein
MVVSRGPRTQVRRVAPPWLGPPIIYCLDYDLLGEGHQIAFIQDFIELHSMGEGPRDHEILHHGIVPKLVLDGVRVVGEGHLEELLKVVCRRSCLALANAYGSHDAPHAGAACYLIVATFVVGCDYYPLRTLLAPLLAALGILDDDVRRHLLAAAWGRFPTAWGRAKFGHLIAGGRGGFWVGAMLTLAVKPQWVRYMLDETIEQSCSDFLAHTLEVCKSAHRYNEYSAI